MNTKTEDLTLIDNLLEGTLDDIQDLPDNKAWPGGVYKAELSIIKKVIPMGNPKTPRPCLIMEYTCVETLELNEGTDPGQAPNPRDKTSVMYDMSNEFGAGRAKKILATIGKATGKTSLADIVTAAQGLAVGAVFSMKMDKTGVARNDVVELMIE